MPVVSSPFTWNAPSPNRRPRRRRALCAAISLLIGALLAGGCSEAQKEKFLGVTQINDKVNDEEFDAFLKVVKKLPESRLPELPAFFGPPPDWSPTRTLPIRDLVKEEQRALDSRWETAEIVKSLESDRRLRKALRKADMSLEEFVNILKTLGAALCRSGLRKDQDLDKIRDLSKITLEELNKDERTFSELPRDEMHQLLRKAIWVTRDNRAKRLLRVPPENVALVKKHQEELAKIFPRELTANPFDPLIDLLEVRGMPFEELPESGSDVELDWAASQVKRGIDIPDPEYRKPDADAQTSALSPIPH